MLWLALHFPQLSLEVFSRSIDDTEAQAVCVGGTGTKATILICNARAATLGIQSGMLLGAACTLADKLNLYPRDEILEQEALKRVAAWATRFTSLVSLVSPQAVLLEIAGSLTLFGNVEKLLQEVRAGLAELGYEATVSVAPTPLSSLWLARHQKNIIVKEKSRMADVVGRLPLSCMQLSERKMRSLNGMGLRRIVDLLRLPRDGLTRRLGKELLLQLDRALGKVSDPQKFYVPPTRFRSRLLLPAEVDNIEALLFAIHRIVTELGGMLLGCGGGVQELLLQLIHREPQIDRVSKNVTHIDLKLAGLSRDVGHLMAVLRERLERVTLEAPVIEIIMVANTVLPLSSQHQDLFTKQGESEHDWQCLRERLCARLGEDVVHSLQLITEHRPERAWRYGPVGEAKAGVELSFGRRPVWLLPEPIPLSSNGEGWPRFHGVLQLDLDRERIESGWWDGNDIARDYFVARNPRGLRLWVYRELRGKQRWFLHGIFA